MCLHALSWHYSQRSSISPQTLNKFLHTAHSVIENQTRPVPQRLSEAILKKGRSLFRYKSKAGAINTCAVSAARNSRMRSDYITMWIR